MRLGFETGNRCEQGHREVACFENMKREKLISKCLWCSLEQDCSTLEEREELRRENWESFPWPPK